MVMIVGWMLVVVELFNQKNGAKNIRGGLFWVLAKSKKKAKNDDSFAA
jgi:predicted cobalt transporter CbtA